MKILVTGGAGFIGSNFINHWFENNPNDQIINFDKLTYSGNLDNTKSFAQNPNYTFIKGDICNEGDVKRAMEGVDLVVHFAAESHVDRSIDDPFVFTRSNALGTHILLETARQLGIKRFHHISTDEVFGHVEADSTGKFTEDTPHAPRSPYSASKSASDLMVMAYFHTYGLPVTITNGGNNYGPYCHPEKFIPRAITNILSGGKIKIYGAGNQKRPWVYVEDHCRAIELVIKKGKIGETYMVGANTQETSNLEIAKIIVAQLGESEDKIEFVNDRPGHDEKYALDWSKIKNELGWEPLMNFEEGLAKTVNWYKENTDYWKETKKETDKFYAKINR